MGVLNVSAEQWDQMMESFDRADIWRADQMPDEASAIRVLNEAYRRLIELGWRERMYAPAGENLEVIEVGSTGIHKAYRDEQRRFWVCDGDVWPSDPVLWRLDAAPKQRLPAADAGQLQDGDKRDGT